MRLICPNCDAQYEVVDDVIPPEGRDVQCSNCGQTWFQHHPDHLPEVDDEDEAPSDIAPPTEDAPAPAEEEAVETSAPKRRELDPAVTDILREEADLEAQARATEAEALESQPELGLESAEAEADRHARETRARLRGEDTTPDHVSEAAATAAAVGSRRDLLPDIEEINSTLRSTGDRQAAPPIVETSPEQVPQKSSGFRRGFVLMIALAVILAAIYLAAPNIAQSFPQADPYLSAYVAQVDVARMWLDGQVANLLTWLDSLTASET